MRPDTQVSEWNYTGTKGLSWHHHLSIETGANVESAVIACMQCQQYDLGTESWGR